ncbi:MAG TPA: hypothetical protein VNC84_05460 [Gammaproteobacteria bacterium]|jgi:hypothetical protein|nr:hypothetical protein [Gammaproteobacteria bacterium]
MKKISYLLIIKKFLITLTLAVFVLTLPGCASMHSQTGMEKSVSTSFQASGKQATPLSKQPYHAMAEEEETSEKRDFVLKSVLVVGAVLGVAAVIGYVILPALATAGVGGQAGMANIARAP